eukprot:7251014-Lingulodinium_polyedra.AAC.1
MPHLGGIGGVLFDGATPVAYYADRLRPEDLLRFGATDGDSAFTTVWEALAILVGVRLWRGPHHRRATLT